MLSRVADASTGWAATSSGPSTRARLLDVHLNLTLDRARRESPSAALGIASSTACRCRAPTRAERADALAQRGVDLDRTLRGLDRLRASPRARENARQVREQITRRDVGAAQPHLSALAGADRRDPAARTSTAGRSATTSSTAATSFKGITDATMSHGEGWQLPAARRASSSARSADRRCSTRTSRASRRARRRGRARASSSGPACCGRAPRSRPTRGATRPSPSPSASPSSCSSTTSSRARSASARRAASRRALRGISRRAGGRADAGVRSGWPGGLRARLQLRARRRDRRRQRSRRSLRTMHRPQCEAHPRRDCYEPFIAYPLEPALTA